MIHSPIDDPSGPNATVTNILHLEPKNTWSKKAIPGYGLLGRGLVGVLPQMCWPLETCELMRLGEASSWEESLFELTTVQVNVILSFYQGGDGLAVTKKKKSQVLQRCESNGFKLLFSFLSKSSRARKITTNWQTIHFSWGCKPFTGFLPGWCSWEPANTLESLDMTFLLVKPVKQILGVVLFTGGWNDGFPFWIWRSIILDAPPPSSSGKC